MINCLIFDLDGTLTDTLASIARPVNRTLLYLGLPEMPLENFKYYVGDGLENTLRRALRDAGDPAGLRFDEGMPLCRKWFDQDPMYHVVPCPGIPELLSRLKERGLRIGVCTNKPQAAAETVVRTLFGDLADRVRGAREGLPLKPDPAGVRELLEAFGADRAEALYIGDSDTDMRTGRNAGLKTIGVTWGFRQRAELEQAGADGIVERPEELMELVRS